MKTGNNYALWLRYSSFGLQLLISTALAVWGGIKLDEKLGVSPLITISLPLLVMGVTFYKLIRDITKKQTVHGKKARDEQRR